MTDPMEGTEQERTDYMAGLMERTLEEMKADRNRILGAGKAQEQEPVIVGATGQPGSIQRAVNRR